MTTMRFTFDGVEFQEATVSDERMLEVLERASKRFAAPISEEEQRRRNLRYAEIMQRREDEPIVLEDIK